MKVHHEQGGRIQYFRMGGGGDTPHRTCDCCICVELMRRALPRTPQVRGMACCGFAYSRDHHPESRQCEKGRNHQDWNNEAPSLAVIVHRVLQSGRTVVVICSAIRRCSQLQRSGVSSLRQLAQAGVTKLRTFNYFAGDHPPGTVFSAYRKK